MAGVAVSLVVFGGRSGPKRFGEPCASLFRLPFSRDAAREGWTSALGRLSETSPSRLSFVARRTLSCPLFFTPRRASFRRPRTLQITAALCASEPVEERGSLELSLLLSLLVIGRRRRSSFRHRGIQCKLFLSFLPSERNGRPVKALARQVRKHHRRYVLVADRTGRRRVDAVGLFDVHR